MLKVVRKSHTWFSLTTGERIANKSLFAHANCEVVCDVTDCVDATSSWTWISALLIDASHVRWTFAVEDTLWSTSYKWIALKSRLAGADCSVASCLTDGIGAAWPSLTGISFVLWLLRWDDFRPLVALGVRVSNVVFKTRTPGCVVDDMALRVEPTHIFARIFAFLTDAGKAW